VGYDNKVRNNTHKQLGELIFKEVDRLQHQTPHPYHNHYTPSSFPQKKATFEADMREEMSKIGPVESVEMRKSYCFVTFVEQAHATTALETLNGKEVFGKTITIEYTAAPKADAAGGGGEGGGGRGGVETASRHFEGEGSSSASKSAAATAVTSATAFAASNEPLSNELTVFVGNLDKSVSDEELRGIFTDGGLTVLDADIKVGFAFITLDTTVEAGEGEGDRHEDEGGSTRRCMTRQEMKAKLDGLPNLVVGGKTINIEISKTTDTKKSREAKRKVEQKPANVIFVVGYDHTTENASTLQREFSRAGAVVFVDIRKSFCFITYESIPMATQAVHMFNGYLLHGKKLTVEFSTAAASAPVPAHHQSLPANVPVAALPFGVMPRMEDIYRGSMPHASRRHDDYGQHFSGGGGGNSMGHHYGGGHRDNQYAPPRERSRERGGGGGERDYMPITRRGDSRERDGGWDTDRRRDMGGARGSNGFERARGDSRERGRVAPMGGGGGGVGRGGARAAGGYPMAQGTKYINSSTASGGDGMRKRGYSRSRSRSPGGF